MAHSNGDISFPRAKVVRPATLRTLEFESFCSPAAVEPDGSSSTEERMGLTFAPWALGHVLRFGPQTKAFDSYLDTFAAGVVDPVDAWTRTLGPSDAAIASSFEAFLDEPAAHPREVTYAPPPVAIEEHLLTSADVQATWALVTGARKHAEDAVAAAPSSAEARFALGVTTSAPNERAARFREALERAPNDPHYLHALVRELFNQQLASPAASRSWAAIEPLASRLAGSATTALQLEFLAAFNLEVGKVDDARALIVRSIELDPGCVPCRETAARVYERRSEWSLAITAQHVAAGLSLTENEQCMAATKRLRELRARAPKSP
jgi:hypothetical protein